ncbi:hypothetical protein D9Q98_009252 [Chlorella vulgaris]|uniref:Uncharacterized protein n=1 Tax=Chlorella vulgaris TaxID=3077 RepID=A0A9D4YWW0_CHLVU|nr:hypothetical protein D9Q98_009252 [Chlorella vulgaris]
MARTKQTARRGSGNAADDTVVQDQSGGQAVMRQRRGSAKAPASVAATQETADEPFVDPCESMPWYQYYPWQYGGLLGGLLAFFGTIYFYDQQDPYMVWKLMAWMALAFISLGLHETRPYKRMTYQDKAAERGIGLSKLLMG